MYWKNRAEETCGLSESAGCHINIPIVLHLSDHIVIFLLVALYFAFLLILLESSIALTDDSLNLAKLPGFLLDAHGGLGWIRNTQYRRSSVDGTEFSTGSKNVSDMWGRCTNCANIPSRLASFVLAAVSG